MPDLFAAQLRLWPGHDVQRDRVAALPAGVLLGKRLHPPGPRSGLLVWYDLTKTGFNHDDHDDVQMKALPCSSRPPLRLLIIHFLNE